MASDASGDVTILDAAEAHYARGQTLSLLKRWSEALEAFEAAIAARPDYADAWNLHGAMLHEMGEDYDALESFRRALELQPNYPDVHSNMGVSLRALDRCEEAIEAADRALAIDPGFAAAFTTRANALRSLGRNREALETYDRAVSFTPDSALVRFNRAVCLLLLGDFERGWEEYEWRWDMASHHERPRIFEQPTWRGEGPVTGKRIILHREQGFGDTIQFCRYASLVAELGATVILGTSPSLHGLMGTLPGVSLIVSTADALPAFDLQCPLLSLPLAFNTRLETIPAKVPYLSVPEPHRRKWRERLGPKRNMRIGLAWSGNPEHAGDRFRTISLETAVSMLPRDATIHCLQKEIRPSDVPALAMAPHVVFHGTELGDFSDTAALIAEMDLVVSIDTVVLHLAGALAVPTWGLIPMACDWRWLTDRSDSPWYPTLRLFRQTRTGDWETVAQNVRDAMAEFRQRVGRENTIAT